MKRYATCLFINNQWVKVRPIINKYTNMGIVPKNSFMTSLEVPFLTNDKDYFLVQETSENLTPNSTEDYILKEMLKYTAYIGISV